MADPVLASTSPYRRELLSRVLPRFDCLAPGVAELPLEGETLPDRALRLARDKAAAVALQRPLSLVIGADQVADLSGLALPKPGNRSTAAGQLRACSGRTVLFHTAVCVLAPDQPPRTAIDQTSVRFRVLDEATIAAYLEREQPWDCAGSFKAEGLGIALFDAIDSGDPTALVGLPLIATCRLLRAAGLEPLAEPR